MDLQFYGANCITITHKGVRIVVDDNLAALGGKSITKADDVCLFTSRHDEAAGRLQFDGPGEYEVADISIVGIPAQSHVDEDSTNTTMYKLLLGDVSILITGHINPKLSEAQMEAINLVDVMFVPVGGNGYTVDPVGAVTLIKEIEPKIVVPTHYADKSLKYEVPQQSLADALKEIGMEPKETTSKLKLKPTELTDVTQLVILEKS